MFDFSGILSQLRPITKIYWYLVGALTVRLTLGFTALVAAVAVKACPVTTTIVNTIMLHQVALHHRFTPVTPHLLDWLILFIII